jgi:hypothetical protein
MLWHFIVDIQQTAWLSHLLEWQKVINGKLYQIYRVTSAWWSRDAFADTQNKNTFHIWLNQAICGCPSSVTSRAVYGHFDIDQSYTPQST